VPSDRRRRAVQPSVQPSGDDSRRHPPTVPDTDTRPADTWSARRNDLLIQGSSAKRYGRTTGSCSWSAERERVPSPARIASLPRGAPGRLSLSPPRAPLLVGCPLLVCVTVAGPDVDRGVVGGAVGGDVEAEAGLDSDDGCVGVDPPLLVRAAVA